jgi:hypothetical protein
MVRSISARGYERTCTRSPAHPLIPGEQTRPSARTNDVITPARASGAASHFPANLADGHTDVVPTAAARSPLCVNSATSDGL